jgi:hypothetical protein
MLRVRPMSEDEPRRDRRQGCEIRERPDEDDGIEPPARPGNCLRGQAQFREILWFCLQRRTNRSHLWKTGLVASSGLAGNSASRDSERFLAVGAVSKSDRLVVELVQRPDAPDAILIKWPPQPTVTDPAKLTATIAAIVRVLGTAQIELAARRAAGR